MSEKKDKLVTPIGLAKWPHVHTPKPPYKDASGQEKGAAKYQIDIVFDPKDPNWASWANDLKKEWMDLPTRKNKQGEVIQKWPVFKKELGEDDLPTGRVFVTFKTGLDYPPGVFDRYGKAIPPETKIGNGSKVRVSYTKDSYQAAVGDGISLYLGAVQVVELVEYKSRSASSFGFEVEDEPLNDDFGEATGKTVAETMKEDPSGLPF